MKVTAAPLTVATGVRVANTYLNKSNRNWQMFSPNSHYPCLRQTAYPFGFCTIPANFGASLRVGLQSTRRCSFACVTSWGCSPFPIALFVLATASACDSWCSPYTKFGRANKGTSFAEILCIKCARGSNSERTVAPLWAWLSLDVHIREEQLIDFFEDSITANQTGYQIYVRKITAFIVALSICRNTAL